MSEQNQAEQPSKENTHQLSKEIEFDNILKIEGKRILSKIKWQLNLTNRLNGEKRFDKNIIERQLDGLLRGELAERFSETLQIGECETVYDQSGLDLNELKVSSFRQENGENTKEKILAQAVRKSLVESPPKRLLDSLNEISDGQKRDAIRENLTQEIVSGYSDSGKGYKGGSGIFYQETVIPDGVLVERDGSITGLVEVKAYLPDEMQFLVKTLSKKGLYKELTSPSAIMAEHDNNGNKNEFKLGIEIESEVGFVDTLRTVGAGLPELGTDMSILLRFPKDISTDLLKRYGEIFKALGYRRAVIQKLPITLTDLRTKAKKFIRDNMENITSNEARLKFSKKEIEILRSYAGISE